MFEAYRMGKRAGYAGCHVNACPFSNLFYKFWWEIGYYDGLKLSLVEWLFNRSRD